MTKAEAGKLGGQATAAKYGTKPHICPKYKRLCPLAVECPSEFHSENGKKGASLGGLTTVAKHGTEHMRIIGLRGGRGKKKEGDNGHNGSAINSAEAAAVPDILS